VARALLRAVLALCQHLCGSPESVHTSVNAARKSACATTTGCGRPAQARHGPGRLPVDRDPAPPPSCSTLHDRATARSTVRTNRRPCCRLRHTDADPSHPGTESNVELCWPRRRADFASFWTSNGARVEFRAGTPAFPCRAASRDIARSKANHGIRGRHSPREPGISGNCAWLDPSPARLVRRWAVWSGCSSNRRSLNLDREPSA
jgi:hypothetical protein